MKKLIQIIKNLQIKQVLTIFLVSSLVLVSTACSQGNIDSVVRDGKESTGTARTEGTVQTYKGGMNGYNDDDSRYDAETAAKAKGLVDTARNRQEDNLGDYLDNITDRAGNKIDQAKEDIPRKLRNRKGDAADYIDNKSDKLQRNLKNAPDEARKIFDGATDTAQDALRDADKAAKGSVKEIKGNIKDLT